MRIGEEPLLKEELSALAFFPIAELKATSPILHKRMQRTKCDVLISPSLSTMLGKPTNQRKRQNSTAHNTTERNERTEQRDRQERGRERKPPTMRSTGHMLQLMWLFKIIARTLAWN